MRICAPSRPKSVSVIAWLFIGMGLIALNRVVVGPLLAPEFGQYYTRLRSEHPIEYALLYIGPVIQIVSGAFVLFGHNWARWLLGMLIAFSAVASGWNENFKRAVIDVGWFVIGAYYLFRPGAKSFFAGRFEVMASQGTESAAKLSVERTATGASVGDKGQPQPPPLP